MEDQKSWARTRPRTRRIAIVLTVLKSRLTLARNRGKKKMTHGSGYRAVVEWGCGEFFTNVSRQQTGKRNGSSVCTNLQATSMVGINAVAEVGQSAVQIC